MRTPPAVFLSFLLFLFIADTGYSSGDAPASLNRMAGKHGGDLSGEAISFPDCGCPDIAYTESFKSGRLGYVKSAEFAESVRAVASGASEYSPREIPPGWKTIAADWVAFLATHPEGEGVPDRPKPFLDFPRGDDRSTFLKDSESCAPALIYLASLDYRSRAGRQDVSPVFPRIVRKAVGDLDVLVAVKRQMAERFATRSAAIGSRIAEAERMGAGSCEPGELARAKSELYQARIGAAGVRSSLQETEALFDRSEQVADTLLAKRQFAARNGFKCYME